MSYEHVSFAIGVSIYCLICLISQYIFDGNQFLQKVLFFRDNDSYVYNDTAYKPTVFIFSRVTILVVLSTEDSNVYSIRFPY